MMTAQINTIWTRNFRQSDSELLRDSSDFCTKIKSFKNTEAFHISRFYFSSKEVNQSGT